MKKINQPLVLDIGGGLGNQLFMLTAGIYLREKYQRQIIFDVTDLDRISKLHPGHNVHSLGLLSEFECTKGREFPRGNKLISNRYTRQIFQNLKSLHSKSKFRIPEIGYFDFDFLPSDSKRVVGYFQTWRYFQEVRQKLDFSKIQIGNHTNWFDIHIEKIRMNKVVGVHIRRGDYVLPLNRANGILSETYYESVLEKINPELETWIFTDDPIRVRKEFINLELAGRKIYILEPPENSDPIESMLLLSESSQIVISNSTYSWWSASMAKIGTPIYAPSKWFELRSDPLELIPDNWKKIKSEWISQ